MDLLHSDNRPPMLRQPRISGPILPFLAAAAAFLVLALALAVLLETGRGWSGPLVTLVAFAAVTGIAGLGLRRHYPHDRLGFCNIVTLLRGALMAALASVLIAPDLAGLPVTTAWQMTGIAALSLSLDGVDGKLARASGLVSDFGARFDMEVDAVFALVLSLIVWLTGAVGVWVLTLGVMRYLYVIAGWALPWLNGPLPEQVMRRKTVCVIQIGALVVLLSPIVPALVATLIAGVASALLIWSFAVDVIWLYQRRET